MENDTPKKISRETLMQCEIWDVDTWPYGLSGRIKKTLTLSSDRGYQLELEKKEEEERQHAKDFVQQFSEKQKTAVGWILAATIGVLGNLAVNLAFGSSTANGNSVLAFVVLSVILVLVVAYLFFLPKISMVYWLTMPFIEFPDGYEKNINPDDCSNPISKKVIAHNRLSLIVMQFGGLIRASVLKHHLQIAVNSASSVGISDFRVFSRDLPIYLVEISTKGVLPWLDPRGKEKVKQELMSIIMALQVSRLGMQIYSFELDEQEWTKRGPAFLDAVSDWNFDEVHDSLLAKFRPLPPK